MKKLILILIFIFIILPIILIAILGADIYLTVSNFSPDKVSVDVSQPTVDLSSDNKSILFSMTVNITTPPAGFIPKGILVTVNLFYNDTNQIGTPITFSLELGKSSANNLSQTIELTPDMTQTLSQGGSIAVVVKSTADLQIFGFTVYSFQVPDQNFNIP